MKHVYAIAIATLLAAITIYNLQPTNTQQP